MKQIFTFIAFFWCLMSTAQDSQLLKYYRLDGMETIFLKLTTDSYFCEEESDTLNYKYSFHNEDKSFYCVIDFFKTGIDFNPHEYLSNQLADLVGIEVEHYDEFINLMIGNGYVDVHQNYSNSTQNLSMGVITNIQEARWAAFITVIDKHLEEESSIASEVIGSFRVYVPETDESQ